MESNSFTVYHGSARKFPPCDSLSTSSSTRLSRRSTIHSGGLLMNKNPRAYWSMAREATTRPTSRWYSKRVSAFCRKVVQNRGPDSGSPVFFLSDRLKGKRRGWNTCTTCRSWSRGRDPREFHRSRISSDSWGENLVDEIESEIDITV